MSTQAGLKAGGIGAAVMVVLALLGLIPIPFLGCLCCLVVFGALIGDGVLAANFMPAPRAAGAAAGTGALAGLVSGVGYGLVTGIVTVVRALMGGASASSMSQYLTPDVLKQLQSAGIDPQTYASVLAIFSGVGGGALCGGLCCVGALVLGAALGAIGGAIGGAVLKK